MGSDSNSSGVRSEHGMPERSRAIGAEFLRDLPTGVSLWRVFASDLLAAVRREKDALKYLHAAVEVCLGQDRFSTRPKAELDLIRASVPGVVPAAELERLEDRLRVLSGEHRRLTAETANAAPNATAGPKLGELQSDMVQVGRQIDEANRPVRKAEAQDWLVDLAWVRSQQVAGASLLHSDARARHLAARLLLGLEQRPRSLAQLRRRLMEVSPRLPPEAAVAVNIAHALLGIDRVAGERCAQVEGDKPVGGFLTPGSSPARWKWVHLLLDASAESSTDPRRVRRAACAVGSIVALDNLDCLGTPSTPAARRVITNALVDLGVGDAALALVFELLKPGLDAEQALDMVIKLDRAAEKRAPKRASPSSMSGHQSKFRDPMTLYLSGRNIHLGSEALRYGKRDGKGRPISLSSRPGRLLLWLAMEKSHAAPRWDPVDRSNLAGALKRAGGAIKLPPRRQPRLVPLPLIDPTLRAAYVRLTADIGRSATR